MVKPSTQGTLFQEPEIKESRRNVYVYLPNKLGNYDRYEVVSAFRKSVKLGIIEDAFYWLTVILKYGKRGSRGFILRQCWIMCHEDIFDITLASYCSSLIMVEKEFYLYETDAFYQLVWRMCKALKWWENGEGRSWDDAWGVAEGEVESERRQIPNYALDMHTRIGKEMFDSGSAIHDQFSGTEIGRQKTRYIFERDGGLNKDADIDEGFWLYWKKYQKTLLGK